MPPTTSGWIPQVKVCSAYQNEGITEVWEMINQFAQHQSTNGFFYENRQQQNIFAFHRLLQEQLRDTLLRKPGLNEQIKSLEQQITEGNISPYTAVGLILN
jgi:LAO/AO transport system kinase